MEVTRAELFNSVWSEPLGNVASRYGLTGNGLAKICDRLAIPRPPRSHWTRSVQARDAQPPLPPAPLGLSDTFALGSRQPRQSPGTRHHAGLIAVIGPARTLRRRVGGGLLRLDLVEKGGLTADGATVTPEKPDWAEF